MLFYMIENHVENTVNYDIVIITKAQLYLPLLSYGSIL
jgi:hypothetical protein